MSEPAPGSLHELAERLHQRLHRAPEAAKQADAVYLFDLAGWGQLTMTVGDGRASAWVGGGAAATCTVTMSAQDAVSVIEGRANPLLLFLSGRIGVHGDLGAAGRLGELLR